MKDHEFYMRQALNLAKKAEGLTSPNPIVGCVVVKDGRVIGSGYHKKAGLPHAEVNALNKTRKHSKNASLYVTLEPCDHYGKTPPCTDLIIKKGIKEVVIGMKDPNPVNNGKGVKKLRQNGIKVTSGILKEDVLKINEPFVKYIRTKMPFVVLKIAESLDGKIAASGGDSKWISNAMSRRYVQRLRANSDGIMVGINTVIKDDPMLLPRVKSVKNPIRIIVDSFLKLPLSSKLVKTSKEYPVKVLTTDRSPLNKRKVLVKKGLEVIVLKSKSRRVDLKKALKEIAKRNILSVLVEGGRELAGSLVDEKLVDKVFVFIAPKIIGGKGSIGSIGGKGVKNMSEAINLKRTSIERFGNDVLMSGYIK